MSCPICCINFNKTKHLAITCPNSECGQQACRTCTRTYLLDSIQDPHCMHCRTAWDHGFVKDALCATFMKSKEYIEHRKEILFEREKGKIPATQEKVAIEVEARRLEKLNLDDEKTIAELQAKIDELQLAATARRETIYELRNGKKKTTKREFIMPCPDEGCKGFLSTAYKCNICLKFSCPKCLVVMGENKDPNHVCDEELVATVQAIRKDSKPCPKCGVSTSKIDGCNQMWCVDCHATWDWRTGEVVTGVIHNPHYFQWARSQSANGEIPRQPGDNAPQNPCENLNFHWNFFNRLMVSEPNTDPNGPLIVYDGRKLHNSMYKSGKLKPIHSLNSFTRLVLHYRHVEIPQLRDIINANNDNLRVKYILGDVDEETFTGKVYCLAEERKRYIDKFQIYDMFQNCATDILRKLSPYNISPYDQAHFWSQITPSMLAEFKQNVKNVYDEIVELVKYCNVELRRFSVNHNVSVIQFCPYNQTCYALHAHNGRTSFKFTKKQITAPKFEYTKKQLDELSKDSKEFLINS